jgi:hypothetical protein
VNLDLLIESLQHELASVAELGDERVAAVANRLAETLGPGIRMRVLDLLAQASLELSERLPSGHVEVRLAGQDPELVFVDEERRSGAAGEDLSARITLRLPDSLKQSIEAAAAREGVSVNAWLVRALARAAEARRKPSAGRRLTGYGES